MQTVSTTWTGLSSLERLKQQLSQQFNGLLIQVFWGDADRQSIPVLQQQLRAVFPDAQVMGTISAGEILQGEVLEGKVVVAVSAFEKTQVRTVLLQQEKATQDYSSLIQQKLSPLVKESLSPKLLLCFLDGLSDGESFAMALETYLPDMPIAGGVAGGTKETCVFDGEQVILRGAVMSVLYSEVLNVHQQFNFNWNPIGPKFKVTKAEKNIVYEINGKRALDFYIDYLGEEVVKNHMPNIALEFPLVFEWEGLIVARACLEVLEGGALYYAGHIKEGQTVQFGLGSHDQILKDSIFQSRQLLSYPAESIFVYSCVARKLLLAKNIHNEVSPLQKIAPTNGFFTHGELVHMNNGNGLLNQTLTMAVLSENDRFCCDKQSLVGTDEKSEKDFKDVMLQAMAHLSTRLSLDLEALKKQYEALAEHDQLTKLFNRYGGKRIIEMEISRAKRSKKPLSVAIIDLDHFKHINDTYGHMVGDEVLKRLASFIQSHTRSYDSAIRWGGEEFLIIFPDTSIEKAKAVLDKLREVFAQEHFSFTEKVTFSGGVTQWLPEKDEKVLLVLFKEADDALYQAKASGRNQIIANKE